MKSIYSKKGILLFFNGLFVVFILSCSSGTHDKELQKHIMNELQASENYKSVKVDVKDGSVSLMGQCDGSNCATEVENMIKSMDGVKSIDNQIQKNETDLTLRSSVQSVISNYPGVQAEVTAGVIVLRGTIEKSRIQPLMNELQPLDAKKIDNQLAIK